MQPRTFVALALGISKPLAGVILAVGRRHKGEASDQRILAGGGHRFDVRLARRAQGDQTVLQPRLRILDFGHDAKLPALRTGLRAYGASYNSPWP